VEEIDVVEQYEYFLGIACYELLCDFPRYNPI
jgi:hypothetical protein